MNLDEFISESLKSIIKGINDAQEYAKDNGSGINPLLDSAPPLVAKEVKVNSTTRYHLYTKVQFDIAVSASTHKEDGIGAGIKVWSIGLGADIKDVLKNETVSRIQFDITVLLPKSHLL